MAAASTKNDDISIAEILKDFSNRSKQRLYTITPNGLATNKDNACVIGIAGCTNSGKTTLSKLLLNMLIREGMRTVVISQDAFYYRKGEHMEKITSRTDPNISYCNYDTVKSIDTQKFVLNLENAMGENDFVIVEGNMILEIDSIRQHLQSCIFITLKRELCVQRRAARKYDPPDLPGYFDEVVWPAYKNHLAHALSLARRSFIVTFVDGNTEKFPDMSEVKNLLLKLSRNLLLIQDEDLKLSNAISFVSRPKDGGISIFLGTTRDSFDGKQVVRLEFEAYDEMVYKELDKLCNEVRRSYPAIDRIALFHRVGEVAVGKASVIIAVSAPHRRDAIRATEKAIDYLKSKVPIWKKEIYFDGSSSWKENLEYSKC